MSAAPEKEQAGGDMRLRVLTMKILNVIQDQVRGRTSKYRIDGGPAKTRGDEI